MKIESYRLLLWNQFRKNPVGLSALAVFCILFLTGLYAPLFASSKPLVVVWHGKLYFPLFRFLFYQGFFSKPIDLFYNILMFTFPLMVLCYRKHKLLIGVILLHLGLFIWILNSSVKDPAGSSKLAQARQQELERYRIYREDPLLIPIHSYPGWDFELKYMTDYGKLMLLLKQKQMYTQHQRLSHYFSAFQERFGREMPTLWAVSQRNELEKKSQIEQEIKTLHDDYNKVLMHWPTIFSEYIPTSHQFLMNKFTLEQHHNPTDQLPLEPLSESHLALAHARNVIQSYRDAQSSLAFLNERAEWLERETSTLRILIPALIRPFHWEDDAGGAQAINQVVPWWELTRINRKDLVASLIFGIRVSMVVGVVAVTIALLIGVPLGSCSGYFAGKTDLVICRLIEIWEAMPTFFMLLLIIALTQSKSIFLVMLVLGIFSWTSFGRFMRAEVFKQRSLPYVLACKSLGFDNAKIMFSHILPNAVPPVLTLLPFAMMSAVSSEAGLSFLGLGEEGATSWGVLMDEGRSVFPAESYLLWPPAILLTILLITIALIGDVIRDAIDPKLRT